MLIIAVKTELADKKEHVDVQPEQTLRKKSLVGSTGIDLDFILILTLVGMHWKHFALI